MLLVDYETYKGAPEGNDCWFMESNGVGLKFYDDEEDRDEAYELQEYLYTKSLAPETFNKGEAEFTEPDATRMYYYETEVAQTRQNCDRPKSDYYGKFDYLETQLLAVGVEFVDWIVGNVGFIGDRAVVIDCGYTMKFIKE